MSLVAVVDSPEGHDRDLALERQHLPKDARVIQVTFDGDEDTVASTCRDAVAILSDYAPLRRSLLVRLPALRLVSVAATGWDSVDLEAARELDISVCAVREYCTNEVADHTLALLLALERRVLDFERQVREDRDWSWDRVSGLQRLSGKVLGIIGLGRIGRAVARRARSFGVEVIAHDPWLPATDAPADIPLLPLDILLGKADIISLHCQAAAGQKAVLDEAAFEAMTRRPIVLNVARGSLIDEIALRNALDRGDVSGAALDVLAEEPPDLTGHPLLGLPNVIITPHVAFSSTQALEDVRRISAENIRHFLEGDHEAVFGFVHQARRP